MKVRVKKISRWAGRTLLALVVFLLLYGSTAFVASRITVNKEENAPAELAIYIKTNGVHTDIVMPVHTKWMDWSQEIKYSNTTKPDTTCQFIAVGWGDKGFYLQTPQWSDLKFSVAFNAAFGLSTTAMHATFYKELTENENCRKIWISGTQYQRLIQFINESFRKDANGHFMYIPTNANYGPNDAFYDANGTYSLFYTCNTWANCALKHCGQTACLWTILKTGIFSKYNK